MGAGQTQAAQTAKHEFTAHYRSFAADAGGFQALGGHLRLNRFLFSAHLLSGGVEASVVYTLRPPAGAIEPRFGLGAGYYYTFSLIAAVGISVRLFRIFGGSLGLALDQWIYCWPANRMQMQPWTLLGVSYAFG